MTTRALASVFKQFDVGERIAVNDENQGSSRIILRPHTEAIGKRTAQTISARETVEPFLEWRVGEASIVTRV